MNVPSESAAKWVIPRSMPTSLSTSGNGSGCSLSHEKTMDQCPASYLLVVTNRLSSIPVGVLTFGKRSVVDFPTSGKRPEHLLLLLLRRGEPELVCFLHCPFCPSTYRLSVSRVTPPTV